MVDMRTVKIEFYPETHQYYADGIELQSATGFIKRFFPKFDAAGISAKVAAKEGKTPEQVRAEWEKKRDDSARFGTEVHKYAEAKALGKPLPTTESIRMKRYFRAVDKVFSEHKPIVAFSERIVGSINLGIAGTIDLGTKKEEGIILTDWKTNESIDVYSTWGSKCHFPLTTFDDCNFNQYSLQLSLYQYILEIEYHEKIIDRKLIHLMEDQYKIINVPYLKDEIILMLVESGKMERLQYMLTTEQKVEYMEKRLNDLVKRVERLEKK